MTDCVTFYPALDKRSSGLVFENVDRSYTIGFCAQSASESPATEKDVASFGGVLAKFRADGNDVEVRFFKSQHYIPPPYIYLLDVFENFRREDASSTKYSLVPGQHLLIPRDAASGAQLDTLVEYINQLPQDVARSVFGAIRRPSLEWRVDQLERVLAKRRRFLPRWVRSRRARIVAVSVLIIATVLGAVYGWRHFNVRGVTEDAIEERPTKTQDVTPPVAAELRISDALTRDIAKVAKGMRESNPPNSALAKLADYLESGDKKQVAWGILRLASVNVRSSDAFTDNFAVRAALLRYSPASKEAQLLAYFACMAYGRPVYQINEGAYFAAEDCKAVAEPRDASKTLASWADAATKTPPPRPWDEHRK